MYNKNKTDLSQIIFRNLNIQVTRLIQLYSDILCYMSGNLVYWTPEKKIRAKSY